MEAIILFVLEVVVGLGGNNMLVASLFGVQMSHCRVEQISILLRHS